MRAVNSSDASDDKVRVWTVSLSYAAWWTPLSALRTHCEVAEQEAKALASRMTSADSMRGRDKASNAGTLP